MVWYVIEEFSLGVGYNACIKCLIYKRELYYIIIGVLCKLLLIGKCQNNAFFSWHPFLNTSLFLKLTFSKTFQILFHCCFLYIILSTKTGMDNSLMILYIHPKSQSHDATLKTIFNIKKGSLNYMPIQMSKIQIKCVSMP